MATITRPQVTASLTLADGVQSKLPEYMLDLYGHSSYRLKSFINNICSKKNTNYLEIGVGRGSTILSAVYENETCKATGIENYMYDAIEPTKVPLEGTIWYNMQSQLKSNLSRYGTSDNNSKKGSINIIEEYFEKVMPEDVPKADVVYFDVTPVNEKVYSDFFENIVPYISSSSVIIFSNFSNTLHERQIRKAFEEREDKVKVLWEETRVTSSLNDASNYYSGIGIFGVVRSHKAVGKE